MTDTSTVPAPAPVVAPTGLDVHPGVLENIAALSPCPVCNADALSGPEGWGRGHLPHCWKCGYNWKKRSPVSVNAPAVPSLAPAQVSALAQAVVQQLKDAGWAPPAQPAQAPIAASSTDTTATPSSIA